jgi:hypothetical protein
VMVVYGGEGGRGHRDLMLTSSGVQGITAGKKMRRRHARVFNDSKCAATSTTAIAINGPIVFGWVRISKLLKQRSYPDRGRPPHLIC